MKRVSKFLSIKNRFIYYVFVIIIIVFILFRSGDYIKTKTFEKNIIEMYNYNANSVNGQVMFLKDITDFDWDIVVSFRSKSNIEDIASATNISSEKFKHINFRNHAGFIFIKNGEIVYIYSKRSNVDFTFAINMDLSRYDGNEIFVQNYEDATIKVYEYGDKRLII